MTIYFVAGEASADNHGAALMCALRRFDADLQFIGRGGPEMKMIAGEQFENWIDQSGVLGLWEVIKHYAYFRKQFHTALNQIAQSKPDAVVLMDYPGFNLRLARALHRNRTVRRLIYYISPQVWAWNRGRIRRMAQWVDLMLCIFPFEVELYNQSGLRTIFVGHPMIERLRTEKIDRLRSWPAASSQNQLDRPAPSNAAERASQPDEWKASFARAGPGEAERDPNLIGLFPGSRSREVSKIFPVLIETAQELLKLKPDLRFEVAAASAQLAWEMKEIAARSAVIRREGAVRGAVQYQDRQLFEIKVGETAAIMQRAFVGIVASGSATLEAAYFRLPFLLVYKVSWLTYLAGRLLVRVKYLGMPNVLAGKEVVPEFIQHCAQPRALAQAISRLLDEPSAREQMISEFDTIVAELGEGGASEGAAKAILEELDPNRPVRSARELRW